MDKIIIQGLQVKSLIGVYDWERVEQKTLLLDIELDLSLSKAGVSDQVSDTIDYAQLAGNVEKLCADSEFQLLEALGEYVLAQLLKDYISVEQAQLTITKPNMLANVNAVQVVLCRKRS